LLTSGSVAVRKSSGRTVFVELKAASGKGRSQFFLFEKQRIWLVYKKL
jgi:hypothetical protein